MGSGSIMEQKIKDNLLRLWLSPDMANHDLAFQMFSGLRPSLQEYEWLWNVVFPSTKNIVPREETRLHNFPNISIADILQGRILALLLQHEEAIHWLVEYYCKHKRLQLPYIDLEEFPSTFRFIEHDIQELIWQDGELETLGESITYLPHLRRIDLRRQPITYIHPAIVNLPYLEEIHLISTSFLPEELMDRQDIEIYTDAPY